MSKSYEDYELQYESHLSRIRSILASARSEMTMAECELLLGEARQCVTAMQGLAEVDGDQARIQASNQRLERDLPPIQAELSRYQGSSTQSPSAAGRFGSGNNNNSDNLFYQPPDLESGNEDGLGGSGGGGEQTTELDRLLTTSEDLLRESQALCVDSEQVGMGTLTQMHTQREQLQITNDNLEGTTNAMVQARSILKRMRQKFLRDKLALQMMVAFLVVANLTVLYWIFKKHFGSHH